MAGERPEIKAPKGLQAWMPQVAADWRKYWRGRDHRYGRDFASFVGERLMTDYNLRRFEESTPLPPPSTSPRGAHDGG